MAELLVRPSALAGALAAAGHRDTFTGAYGYDILDWSGFPAFRAIRELTMTTWLMQLVDDPRAAREFRRRVNDIRESRFPRHWRAF